MSSQNLNLSVSGLWTSVSDFNGLPPGALDEADNVESRYKNVMEPRRGFQQLPDSEMDVTYFIRLANFYVAGIDRVMSVTSDGDWRYYTGANPWPLVPGDVSQNIQPPDAINGKSRFVRAGQNIYLTAQDGVRSLSSGSTAEAIRAGVPKGLNLEAETNGDLTGFFDNNVVLDTTGTITGSSAIITKLDDTTGIEVDMYVGGIEVVASLIVQDLTYTSLLFGASGNAITITYTGGASLVVSVIGTAISVQLNTGVSTAAMVKAAVDAFPAAAALVSVAVSGTPTDVQIAAATTPLAGGLDNTIPIGTKVASITPSAPLIIETATTTAGSTTISALVSITGIVAGVIVEGIGIPDGTVIVSTSGAGPYTAVLSLPAYQTGTGISLTFSSSVIITMDDDAAVSAVDTPITFYRGAQVAYRMVFGRVETDINDGMTTRLGSPSAMAVAENVTPYSTNVTVTGTLPKNSATLLTFVQLYRSEQTDSITITPLDQMTLVYERQLVPQDFIDRIIVIEDTVPDSLVGIPLYTGSDREGILQSNDPPPMCWDMCKFRDFILYGNVTAPTTSNFTIVSVGSPDGVQIGDTITISGSFLGVAFSEVYTAASSENQAARQFAVITSGTPSQDITDTAASLIRVINYDDDLPVHAILISSSTDLPGQILLEADNPSYDTFTTTASAHADAYDPVLTNLVSEINTVNNGVRVSKLGEYEAVPAANLLPVGDTSSDLLRLIPLRDYVIAIKTDGIYKILGTTPSGLVVNTFDLTTKIIGADTAVSLNSAVWMLSNQGVVSISDGGVEAKSIPIDDQLNRLIGNYLDNLVNVSFAVGYESDRKYILCVPDTENEYAEVEYNYNYITNSWTTWSRNFYTGFVHSNEDKLYISRADPTNNAVSKERKSGTYQDFVDEAVENEITAVDGFEITLIDVNDVVEGDILYQTGQLFSPILAVDLATNVITVQFDLSFTVADCTILKAYQCTMTWKQVFADNPAFVRQFSEGLCLFKNTRFNVATLRFVTDFSQNQETVEVEGTSTGLWGLFPWGEIPWGGESFPSNIRFYIPQNKQLGSYVIPTLLVKQGYSDFRLQGVAILYSSVSPEVGL